MVYGLRSEQLAQAKMRALFEEQGRSDAVRLLDENPVTLEGPLPPAYDAARDAYMHGLGLGTTRDMRSVEREIFLASWLSRDYTIAEKLAYWRGKFWSKRLLWRDAMMTDLRTQIRELPLPAYFLHGRHDYTVAYPLTREFVGQLQAPIKGFYTFEGSAHTPLFEEPERVLEILRGDVRTGTTSRADPP